MKLSLDQLRQDPTQRVKVGVTDLDGVLRAKYLSAEKLLNAVDKGFGFCNVIFGWDIADAVYPEPLPDPGFADASARIDTHTLRSVPWEEGIPFFLGDFRDDNGLAGTACPRSLLLRVIDQASALGFTARFGPEYEWFTYRETPESLAEKDHRSPRPLTPGMFGYSGLRTSQYAAFHRDLYDQLRSFDVQLEGLHTETGPGVLEAAVSHRETLEAADRAVLLKLGVKEISYRHGLVSSFMAKPSVTLPGCGGHLHQSLWRDGTNAFHDSGAADGMSTTLKQYVAGQLLFLPEIMPLFAPTVNSYKRYIEGSWAATRANWGTENRTVALRYIPGDATATRLETRVPGADANPYLAIAAALAAGLYGIEHELELELPMVRGSSYEQAVGQPLPKHLGEATEAMRRSERVSELLGESFCGHFVRSRQLEWNRFLEVVTDWETRRYFEQI
ncbi:glutamine synthetase [Neolewinella xylanilytica]|uniref:Glutamine synthetase n=1 Tax=Neolewinella xylanilytica TaxID=1514080 RepID=A0A2S6I9D0_9BACT|nr:glutamine synthetase [Neolewinella xylanilytica]PPK88107.1 glutamine synthetase [Neolewinella xylanilytica]